MMKRIIGVANSIALSSSSCNIHRSLSTLSRSSIPSINLPRCSSRSLSSTATHTASSSSSSDIHSSAFIAAVPPPPAPSSSCGRSNRPAPSSRPVSVDDFLAKIRSADADNMTTRTAADGTITTATSPSPSVASSSTSPSSSFPPSALVDTFGRFHSYLRISLTERCNLRCVYCMPEGGVDLTPSSSLLSDVELSSLLTSFVSAGVRKVRFTGGEPTVRKDLLSIIAHAGSLRSRGLDQVCMTTNGLVLSRKLESLIQAGLTHVNISLDTLDEHKFTIMTRRKGGKQVLQAIRDAVAAVDVYDAAVAQSIADGSTRPVIGLRSVKVNIVVMKGLNDMEIKDFVELTRNMNVEVRFIEYMPFDGNRWSEPKFVSYSSMVDTLHLTYPTLCRSPSLPNETSKTWHVPGFLGRVGFISSMSDHFCGECNRLRITADGNLKVCLFGNEEVSLRDAMREGKTQEEMGMIVGAAVKSKKAKHAGMMKLASQKNRPMITIGGYHTMTAYAGEGAQRRTITGARSSIGLLSSSSSLHHPSSINRYLSSSSSSSTHPSSSSAHGLSHVDASGTRPHMVDVSGKSVTHRTATAECVVLLPTALSSIFDPKSNDWHGAKGPVLVTAIIAGTCAVKATSTLIPFCHPLPIDNVKFSSSIISRAHDHGTSALMLTCTVGCTARTGVEMEALTGVTVAALTVYDMMKAISHDMVITDTKLVLKRGGKSDINQTK